MTLLFLVATIHSKSNNSIQGGKKGSSWGLTLLFLNFPFNLKGLIWNERNERCWRHKHKGSQFAKPLHQDQTRQQSLTWSARRNGLTGPFAVWAPSHGVCLQTSLPLQPAWTLLPPTASSTYHMSGFICQSTNPPDSALLEAFRFFTTFVAVSNSEATILTFPIAYAFRIEFCSFSPPEAAVYCCNMYWADEVSCKNVSSKFGEIVCSSVI